MPDAGSAAASEAGARRGAVFQVGRHDRDERPGIEAGAGILPTDEVLKRAPSVRFATQSGPMLVIGNHLNPIFIVGSADRIRRSGVGICSSGAVRFAISEDGVNFHDFAWLFRDHLRCSDALFLDGGRGVGIYSPVMGRNDWSWHGGYEPMFGLVE